MKKYLGMIMVIILSFSLLAGCAAQEKPQTIKIGVISDVSAVPFIIAEQQGFFEKRGLDVEIQVFKSAVDRDTALQTGNLSGAMADMLTIVFFRDAGFDVKMTSQTNGNYRLITSPKLTVEDFLALQSPQIGLSSNTVIDFATQKVAEAKAFDGRMTKVAIPQMPVRLEMLRAGGLDGATLPEPLATAAIADGGALVGSTADFSLYPGIFMMTQSTLDQSPKAIKGFYAAYDEAVAYLNQTDSTVYYDYLVEKLGFPAILKDRFEMPEFTIAMPPDAKTYEETAAWMKQRELTKSDYTYEELTDISYLPKS